MKEILSNDDKEKSEKYLNIIKADAISEEIYQELYSLIPESFLVEKDRNMPDIQWISITRKTTKWEFNKEKDVKIIQRLKQFAQDKKLWLGNQLAFNDHFEKMFVWTIYFIEK